MRTATHPLLCDTPGTVRAVQSHTWGRAGARPKIYLQAGQHADEIPGLLVARHLYEQLNTLEAAGQISGEIVLVPVCNPIGLSQWLLHNAVGRFELRSAENFNRNYLNPAELLLSNACACATLEAQLNDDPVHNLPLLRAAMQRVLAAARPGTELASLRHTLLSLACDADHVLDLHCDSEALCHLYITPNNQRWGETLSRYIGARVLLLSAVSGGRAFDEACSTPWDLLREHWGARFTVPVGCHSATLELRGLAEVSDPQAAEDATALLGWMSAVGALKTDVLLVDRPAAGTGPRLAVGKYPVGECVPLAGTDNLRAPFGGVVSFRRSIGEWVVPGDAIADLIDPLSGERATLTTRNAGMFYARHHYRFVPRHTPIARISGQVAFRTGRLSSD